MNILPMTEKNVSQVADLEKRSFSTPWSEKSIREELQNEWALWYVALEGDTFLGYIGIQYGPDGGDIMTIATEPEHRGRGIGKALILHVLTVFKEKQLQYLTLEVRPSNFSALKLYENLGFSQVGRRKNYYKNPTEDALLLTLYLEEEISC